MVKTQKNTEELLDASKKVGLEVKAERTKYMFMCRHQTTGQNHYVMVIINPLKTRQCSDNLKRRYHIRIAPTRK
jgi:hypothetical protein